MEGPLLSVLLPVYDVEAALLEEAVESVLSQSYPHWELCIADDASGKPHIRQILERYASSDSRISRAGWGSSGSSSPLTDPPTRAYGQLV